MAAETTNNEPVEDTGEGKKKKSHKGCLITAIVIIVVMVLGLAFCSSDEPEEMGEMTWPTSGIATTLPVPSWAETDDDGTTTVKGELSTDSEDYFSCDLGVDSKDSFTDYIADCKEAGFTVDYEEGDTYYSADDAAGDHLSLHWYDEDSSYYDCAFISVSVESAASIAESEAAADESEKEETETEEELAEETEDAATSAEEAAEAAEEDSDTTAATDYASYEEIYDDYSQRIIDRTAELVEEYNTQAADLSGDIDALAELCTDMIQELAEIEYDGVEEMARFMYAHYSDDAYDEYESWANELYDVYEEYAGQITDAYMDAAV